MKGTNLAQSLAVESQIRLAGSAGRLMKQIRDIESVAPFFRDAGLIKAVKPPSVVDFSVSGVATDSRTKKALGGFIYVSAAVRTDMRIEQNQVSTLGCDTMSELDDIDFEAQSKRLDLIEMRHAYALVERLLNDESGQQLILIDTPLFLSRDMAPLECCLRHKAEYNRTRDAIHAFWETQREKLYPWNPEGPILASILSQKFSAIVSIARQDLRTAEGRKHILPQDGFVESKVTELKALEEKLVGIGDTRFIRGILGHFTRTIAFRLSEQQKRLEPIEDAQAGVVAFHFRGGRTSQIQMVQLAGGEEDWTSETLDQVAWRLMVLDMQSQRKSRPLPQLLGREQLKVLEQFASYYQQGLHEALRKNEIEDTWITGLDEE